MADGTFKANMIDFDKAFRLILSHADIIGIEEVGLDGILGRILAENVPADTDMPPFNRSAMDGYACKKADLQSTKHLEIIEEIPAGLKPVKQITKGTCAKIMTGAEVPPGADCVIKIEDTRLLSADRVEIHANGNVNHIRYAGEDLRKGDLLISEGTKLNKQHAGLLAMVGCVNPPVYKQPRIGIISTGSELVDYNKTPSLSGIRNSNGPQLKSQLRSININATDFGIVKDDKSEIKNLIQTQIQYHDILLLSGGVSMGDYDFVPEVLEELSFDIKLHKMKVKPGKPFLFAVRGEKFIFGLPGNPVSTFVQFEVIIKPFIQKMMGANDVNVKIMMVMGTDYNLKALTLRYFVPVRFINGLVFPLEYHGSGHLAAYSEADGILEIAEDTNKCRKNDLVYVRPI